MSSEDRPTRGVSVALCTHNGVRFVESQIVSILDQRPPIEQLVLSDDASTDGTVGEARRTVEAFLREHPEVSIDFLVLENHRPLGVTANFQQAVEACTADLIALSDQDDVWHPGRLVMAAQLFDKDSRRLLVHTDARLVDEVGEPLGASLLRGIEYSEEERRQEAAGDAFHLLLRRNVVTGATVVFRRDLLSSALPFPASWVHDEWLAIVAAAIGQVTLLEEETIDYRQHGGNQIGVSVPSLAYKVGRVLEARGDRTVLLARKFEELGSRLAELGDLVPEGFVDAAERKARFEAFRARLPRSRWRRIRPVLSARRDGLYEQLASQGRADMLRDVLQKA
jgi:hypothetical protein